MESSGGYLKSPEAQLTTGESTHSVGVSERCRREFRKPSESQKKPSLVQATKRPRPPGEKKKRLALRGWDGHLRLRHPSRGRDAVV